MSDTNAERAAGEAGTGAVVPDAKGDGLLPATSEIARLTSENAQLRAMLPNAGGRQTGADAASADDPDLASFPERNPAPVMEVDVAGQVRYVNPAAARLVPELRGECLGHPWLADWDALVRTLRANGAEPHVRVVLLGGRCYQQTIYYLADTERVRIYGVDITEARRAEEILQRYDLMALHSRDIVLFLQRDDGRILEANAAATAAYGYEHDELLTLTIHDLRSPETVSWTDAQKADADARGSLFEFVHRRKDGSTFPVEVSSRGTMVGNTPTLVSIIRDVTERKRAEEALRESEEFNRRIIDSSHDCLKVLDLEGRLLYMSPGGQRLLDIADVGPFLNLLWADFWKDEDHTAAIEAVAQANAGGTGCFQGYCPTVAGTPKWWDVVVTPIAGPDGRPEKLLAVSRDISERKRAEDALRESVADYRLLFHNLLDGFAHCRMLFDEQRRPLDFIYLDVNDAFARLTGLNDVVGKRVTEVIPGIKESNPEVFEIYGRVASTGTPERFETYLEALSIWFSVAVYRPKQDHFVAVFDNITARKKAEEAARESDRLHRAIGEAIDYGTWICDPDGQNTYASESFLTLVGLTQEQCSNFGWGDVLHPDDAEQTVAAWQECVRTGSPWDREHRFRGTDGQWHPVLARGVPVRNEQGEVVCWAGINLDISRLKQTEAELRERESALEEASRQKNQFMAVLSHELRNPLTPITNSLFILDRVVPGGEQANRARAVIGRQVSQLTRLVDDLLDVTRIVSGKLRLQRVRFDLAQMLHRTADDHRAMFADAGVEFEVQVCHEPVWMDGDETRMAQASSNLLGNSIKFTERGGRVKLTLEIDAGTKLATIRVSDSGVGVHADILASLFEPFVQADSTLDRSKGGLGLGLALVKSVIELHGGTVAAHSGGPGEGMEFVIHVPFDAQLVLPLDLRVHASSRPPSRRVLVIEDNVDAADSLREAVELDAHQVAVAYDGPNGLKKAREFKPDVVLCDIGLPEMSGYEVAKAFRSDETLRSTYLVALTGYAQPEDLQRAADAGFDAHIAKPPSLEKIEKVLSMVATRAAS